MIVSFCATWTTIVSVLTSKNILTIMKQFTSVNWITPRIWHMTVTWLLMPSFIIVARRWVSNRLLLKLLPRNNIKTIMNVNANFRLFDHSLFTIRYLSLHLSFVNFFFLLQNACDKNSHCQNNATCQSGFTLKGYRCLCPLGFEGERCEIGKSRSQHLKWRICEILSDFQCWYDNCPSVGENGVNLSHYMLCWIFPKENSLL